MNPEQLGMILLAMATTARTAADTAENRTEQNIMYGIATTLRAGVDECIKVGNARDV